MTVHTVRHGSGRARAHLFFGRDEAWAVSGTCTVVLNLAKKQVSRKKAEHVGETKPL